MIIINHDVQAPPFVYKQNAWNFHRMSRLPPRAAFNPAAIDNVLRKLREDAICVFQDVDLTLSDAHWSMEHKRTHPANARQIAQKRFKEDVKSICGDAATLYRVVEDVMWDVLNLSAYVAANHDDAVHARVDIATATVLLSLYASKPVMTLKERASLLYRCVSETDHVFGPETLAVIASRPDQCFRENELLDRATMDLFEKRYHRNVANGYTATTYGAPPYSMSV
jgi:hypothetical protein